MATPSEGGIRWHIYVGGKIHGPYQRPDIESMIAKGQLLGTDFLCVEGGSEWIQAQNDPAFGPLFSNRVDRAALLPDAPSGASGSVVKIYTAKTGTQWRFAAIFLVLGAGGLIAVKHIVDWLSGGPRPEVGAFAAAAAALFLLPLGIIFVANALRGLPRLTVTAAGLTLEAGFRTRRASWHSLGPFALKTVYSRRSRQVRTASAKIAADATGTGSHASSLTIPDHFTVPIDTIVTELNAVRTEVTGDTTPAAADPGAKDAAIGLAQFTVPWLTFGLLAVLIAIFTLENMFGVTPGGKGLAPSIATLIAFGASSHDLVISHHQWYRLFTAPLLHANLAHIVGNGIALVWGGWLLERLIGRLWFFALFFIGALGGSLFSIAVNPVNLVSVGASGALMGLFAALFVSSFRYASGNAQRTRLLVSSLRILVPSLLPFFSTSSVGRIDYGAHIGGTLSGAVVALLLLKFWPQDARLPQLRKTAAAISVIGAVLFVASGALTALVYPKYFQALHRVQMAHPAQTAQPTAPAQPVQPAAPAPQADVLSDHGPKRVACDFKWGLLQQKDPGAYPQFLQNCMKGDSGNP